MNAYQIVGVVFAGVLAAAGTGAGAQALTARGDRRRFPPPGAPGLQAELATLSTNSRQVTVAGATHYTLVSRHEHAAVVCAAIRAVVAAARSGGRVGELTVGR